ncbi:MAG: tetratricopeptide repeat protein [Pseudomonadota bacterium]
MAKQAEIVPTKRSGPYAGWLIFFAVGFIAGVFFSAWKLDKAVPHATSKQSADHPPAVDEKEARNNRMAGLEKMVQREPDNVSALVQLANDHFDAGAYDKAAATYEKALGHDPRNPDVLTDMGTSYRRLGRPQDAVAAYGKALELDPDHSMALFNLGIVLRDDLKKPDEALRIWETFLAKHQSAPHAVMIRPWVEELKKRGK